MSSTTVTYTSRFRLLCRVPDKENKYRDEFVQEKEISISATDPQEPVNIFQKLESKMTELKAEAYKEAARLGGADYQEAKP